MALLVEALPEGRGGIALTDPPEFAESRAVNRQLSVLLVATGLLCTSGCGILAHIFIRASNKEQAEAKEEQRREEERRAAEAQRHADDERIAAIESTLETLAEGGPDPTHALELATLVLLADSEGLVDRRHLDRPALLSLTIHHLEEARAGKTDRWLDLTLATGALYRSAGDLDAARKTLSEGLTRSPEPPLFDALARLPRSATSDAAVVAACPEIRPRIPEAELFDFLDLCITRAADDRQRLQWASRDHDFESYDRELARREEEARRRAEEEAILAAKEAEEEAALAAKREIYQVAAVFAAGRCEFNDCIHRGWRVSTKEGDVRVSCNFNECLTRGWEASFPDGSRATTSCIFNECLTRGWETRFPDGSYARTSCSFNECDTRGWETRLPDGSYARTSCHFNECFTRGWDTDLPVGGRVTCRCSFNECLTRGADCS